MPPIPPDIVRAQIRYELGTEIGINTIHLRFNGPAGDWQLRTQEIANKVRDAYAAQWSNLAIFHAPLCRLVRVDAYHLSADDGKAIEKATAPFAGTGLAGTSSGSSPTPLSVVVSMYGYPIGTYDRNGARKRGRIYMPFLGAGNSVSATNGRVAQPGIIADAYAAIINTLHGQDLTDDGPIAGNREVFPVVLSRTFNEVATVQQVRVDDLFDWQTRRLNALIPAVQARPITQE